MNIGSLYRVKKFYWLLFSSKERTTHVVLVQSAQADQEAAYFSKRYNENVTYFSPDSNVVFLEEGEKDKKIRRVLISEGLIGWTWFDERYNDCFEEVKQ